jgi:DNA-binding transcriptional LysR family regulator
MMNMAGFADVDIRHLQALRAVAGEGSFGRAARSLGFSQAAISQQIAALEKALDVTLFDRPGGPRAVRLTPAGSLVLRHAEAVLDRLGAATAELAELRAGTGGRLVVGTFQSVAVRLLPGLVARLKAESPDLDIRVEQVDETEAVVRGLRDGSLDVAFVEAAVEDPDIATDLVLRDAFVVLLPAGDPTTADLEPGRPYPLERLADRPMIGQGHCSAVRQLEASLGMIGLAPRYVFRTMDNGSMQAMIKAGVGVAVTPLLAVDESDPGVDVRLTDPPLPMRDVLVARRTGVHAVAAADRLAALAVEAGGGRELAPDTMHRLALVG